MDEVTLSKDATDSCVAACDAYIAGLDFILNKHLQSANKDAFGTLDSGRALANKFAGVIIGEPYSLDAVLRQHIDVIQKLQAAFKAAGERYVETDGQNAAKLTAQQPK